MTGSPRGRPCSRGHVRQEMAQEIAEAGPPRRNCTAPSATNLHAASTWVVPHFEFCTPKIRCWPGLVWCGRSLALGLTMLNAGVSSAQPTVGCLGPMNMCAEFSPELEPSPEPTAVVQLGIGAILKPMPTSENASMTSAVNSSSGPASGTMIPNRSSPYIPPSIPTAHPAALEASKNWNAKYWHSGSLCTYDIPIDPRVGRSFTAILTIWSGDNRRQANCALSLCVSRSASAARASAAATLSSDSLFASPVATIALKMTTYSTSRPAAINTFAIVAPNLSIRSWGNQNSNTISATIPANIRSVARADHRSSDSNFWWGSFFLWPKAEGPYANLIRRSRRRLIIFIVIMAIALSLVVIFR